MSAERGSDGSGADSAKLIYSSRLLYASGGLFAIAGAIWLISGTGTAMGLMFVLLAAAMAAAGWSLGNRR